MEVEEVNNNGNGAVVGTDRGDVRDETWSSWSPPTALDPKLFILFICDVHKMIRTIYWLEDIWYSCDSVQYLFQTSSYSAWFSRLLKSQCWLLIHCLVRWHGLSLPGSPAGWDHPMQHRHLQLISLLNFKCYLPAMVGPSPSPDSQSLMAII